MTTRTKTKILKIQNYLRNNYAGIFDLHSDNIVGIRVGKKVKGGKTMNYNALIFHVINKLEPIQLQDGQTIPSRINLVLNDGTSYNLLTDVEEVGKFQFQYAIGDQIDDFSVNKGGTLGLFLTDGQNAYALTNYHVAAWNLMQNNCFYYDQGTGVTPDVLTIGGVGGFTIFTGEISRAIDAAFVNMGSPIGIVNDLGGGDQVNNQGYVDPDSLNHGDSLFAYGTSVPGPLSVTVVSRFYAL